MCARHPAATPRTERFETDGVRSYPRARALQAMREEQQNVGARRVPVTPRVLPHPWQAASLTILAILGRLLQTGPQIVEVHHRK